MSIHERTKFWCDPTLSNLELLHATYVTHSFAPHMHEGYVLGIIERGVEQFAYRRSQHVASAGSIVFINPGEMHTGSSATEHGWTYRTLYPATELLQRAASDLVGRQRDMPFFAEPVVHDPEMVTEFSLTHRALEEHPSDLERESRLLWTLARLILRYADDRPYPRSFARDQRGVQLVRSYIEENYAENISLGQLATMAHLSPFHLLRSFRDQMNLPPHAYQIYMRIIHAKHLLRLGGSCIDTAIAVGFADQSHFTKHFKRIVGVPPGLYRGVYRK